MFAAKANALCQCEATGAAVHAISEARDRFEAVLFNGLSGDQVSVWASQFRANFPNAVRGSNGLLIADAGGFLPNLSLDRGIWGQSNFRLLQSVAIDQHGMEIGAGSSDAGKVQTGFPFFGVSQDLTKSSNCNIGNFTSEGSGTYFGFGSVMSSNESAFFLHSGGCGVRTVARLYCISR